MKQITQLSFAVAFSALVVSGCAHLPGRCDLAQVAKEAQLQNVTTGDGTFANYTATGYYSSTELGLAVGIPGIKLMELFPAQDDTTQMTYIAKDAKADGANAVINAKPPRSLYTGFPFFFVGIYVDSAAGTGIKTK